MSAQLNPASFAIPTSLYHGYSDMQEVPAKRGRFDDWSNSSGSSPSHSEDLQIDVNHPSSAATSSASRSSDEGTVTEDEINGEAPTFTELKPAAKIVATSGRPIATQSSTDPSHATAVPPSQAVTVNTSQTLISHDARFHSYAEFEEAFEVWKRECLHPFRVASSETLREPDGTVNTVFKYRYVVFHCAHYGEPRMRGIGKRPNQNYLPSGCRAMLRLNYNFNEQVLKITTLHDKHHNHEISAEMFQKVSSKLKRSPCGEHSPSLKKSKKDESVSPSPLSVRNSPALSSNSSHQNSPLAASLPTTPLPQIPQLAQMNQMASMAMAIQQQQMMTAFLNQQKENIGGNQGLHYAGLPRPQPQTPAMLNILGMMGLQQRMILQPNYGLVASIAQPAGDPKPATTASESVVDVEHDFSPPSNIPAPVPVKPVVVKIENSQTPPPQLMAETSIGELEQCVSALAGVSVLADLRQEIVILLTNISEKLTSCSKEDLMLVMGQLKAMISHITGPRHL